MEPPNVDFEKIRKHDGYVYYWTLIDYLKPEQGILSAKVYYQGDCKQFRFKGLSFSCHKEPMGGGTGQVIEPKGNQKIGIIHLLTHQMKLS